MHLELASLYCRGKPFASLREVAGVIINGVSLLLLLLLLLLLFQLCVIVR